MNEPTPTGASEVPPSALESLTQQFLNAAPLGVANHSYALGATFKVAVSPLLRENEELRKERGELGELIRSLRDQLTQGRNDAIARDAELTSLRAEVERLNEMNANQRGMIENRDRMIRAFGDGTCDNLTAELTHLRDRVKELEADAKRLDELMCRNDIMVKVFRDGGEVVLKPYGTPTYPLRAAIDQSLDAAKGGEA